MSRSPTISPAYLLSRLALCTLAITGCSASVSPLEGLVDNETADVNTDAQANTAQDGQTDTEPVDIETHASDEVLAPDSAPLDTETLSPDSAPLPDPDIGPASDADDASVDGENPDVPADVTTDTVLADAVIEPPPVDVSEPLADIQDTATPEVDVGPPATIDVTEDVEAPVEPPDYEGTCCGANGSPGCNKPSCVTLVCEEDPYCCNVTWDKLCASCAGGEEGCAGVQSVCDCDANTAGPCCDAHAGGLCYSLACTIAVCSLDPYCCENTWDSYCVGCAEGGMTYSDVSCAGVEETCGCVAPPPEPTHLDLAKAWAPVWYHDSDDSAYEADYITAYDFDNDTISSNNWENLYAPQSDLRAFIYWSIVETSSHWYILYTDFHPRDWTEDCDPFLPFTEPCHENDMEGAMVMVEKDGAELGNFVLLVTEAHNILHVFRNNQAITALSTDHLETPAVTFEDERHPELYVESKGHGVCALGFDGSDHCEHPLDDNPFPGGDGIVYRYKGSAQEPTSGNDWDVGYDLVSFHDTIWQQRHDICDGACTFDQTFEYQGTTLAKAFDGDSWGEDKANPPWAWDDPDDGPVYRGDFFFRPAHAVTTWLDIPGTVSLTYTFNPFLDAL